MAKNSFVAEVTFKFVSWMVACRVPNFATLQQEKQIYVKTIQYGVKFVSWMLACSVLRFELGTPCK